MDGLGSRPVALKPATGARAAGGKRDGTLHHRIKTALVLSHEPPLGQERVYEKQSHLSKLEGFALKRLGIRCGFAAPHKAFPPPIGLGVGNVRSVRRVEMCSKVRMTRIFALFFSLAWGYMVRTEQMVLPFVKFTSSMSYSASPRCAWPPYVPCKAPRNVD